MTIEDPNGKIPFDGETEDPESEHEEIFYGKTFPVFRHPWSKQPGQNEWPGG